MTKDNKCKLLVGYHKRFDSDYQQLIKKVSLLPGKITSVKSILKDNFIPPLSYLETSNGIVNGYANTRYRYHQYYYGF